MGWSVTLEGNGVGRVNWDCGSVGNGCYVCCKPGVDAILQTSAATVIGDGLAIGKVNAAILDPSTTVINVFPGCWASADHVAKLCAKCTAAGPGGCAEEGINLRSMVSWLLDGDWLQNGGWGCVRYGMCGKRVRANLVKKL